MSQDDRERNFEKALARHLRSSASSGLGVRALGGAPRQSCPHPEILAAYHEQTLSSAELGLWKQHVVACSRCQFVLAQLTATDNLPLEVVPAKDSLLAAASAPSRKQRDLDSRFVNGVRRPPSWRWVLLIPAGAIAATLVAVVSLRTPKSFHLPPSSSVQVAQDQPAPPLSSNAKPAPSAPAGSKEAASSPSPSTTTGAVSRDRYDVANELPKLSASSKQLPNRRSANIAHGPSVNQQNQEQQQVSPSVAGAAGVAGNLDQKKLSAQSAPVPAPNAALNGRLAAAAPPPPPPPASEPAFLDGGAPLSSAAKTSPARPPAASGATPKDKSSNADAISAMSETVEVTAEPRTRAESKAMMRAAALQNPRVFVAPDGKHLWRFGPAGSLERSKDEGLKWSLQSSGVTADLLAGSAPSDRVAWVVGASGTILRTTDGGTHWTKLNSPVASDLTGVRAADAFHASIWFVAAPPSSGIRTYETSDGGVSWSPLPPR